VQAVSWLTFSDHCQTIAEVHTIVAVQARNTLVLLFGVQHRQTDYNSAETSFDFSDENYELVRIAVRAGNSIAGDLLHLLMLTIQAGCF
jgi:hypothetical protein